jgi:hypothetical protein
MSLLEHLREAARHLREAARMAVDWRVKGDVANAGTIVNCAIHVQEKTGALDHGPQDEGTGEESEIGGRTKPNEGNQGNRDV